VAFADHRTPTRRKRASQDLQAMPGGFPETRRRSAGNHSLRALFLLLGFGALARQAECASLVPESSEFVRNVEELHLLRTMQSGMAAFGADLPAALAWAGSSGEWLAILGCAVALVAASYVVSRLAREAAERGDMHLGAMARIIIFVLAGSFFQFMLPVPDRVRAVAFVLFAGAAFVWGVAAATNAALRYAFGRSNLLCAAAVCLAAIWILLGYLTLGLLKLSESSAEAVAAAGMSFWIALVVISVAILGLVLGIRSREPAQPPRNWRGRLENPAAEIVLNQPRWFFGLVLLLIAATVAARIARGENGAFAGGAVALQLLGLLPIAISRLWLEERSGVPWRQIIARCISLVTFIVFWVLLAWAVGIDLVDVASERLGQRAVRILLDIGIAIAVGFLFWQVASAGLDMLAKTGPKDQPASRILTFIPLLRAILVFFAVAATGMIILAALGVNIAPLLAGAGIFGIAIGFGSQALVKDVISGVFYLSDDAFRVGEYINVGKAEGTVESLSVRSMKLRHPNGPVFTIPFGEIGVINNQSRDWILVKLDFLLDFRTDLRVAKRVVKNVSKEIEDDAELSGGLIEPLKFQGVKRMEQHGLVIGTKFTARPGGQYALRREFYERLRDGFAAAGIQFARPRVFVDTAGVPAGTDAKELGAAATTIISDEATK
jgi:small-conductance mechanosensitive channel